MSQIITINNSDGHDPPLQFMVVDRFGLFVDLSKVHGQLFDPTVAEITWGSERTIDGRMFGRVKMKNGTGRTFWDPELIEPYLRAWKMAKGNHDLSEAFKEQQRKDETVAANVMVRHPGWFPSDQEHPLLKVEDDPAA
jgi:hypothetical protein